MTMAPISDDPPLPNDVWRGIHPWVRAVFMLGAPTVAAGYLIYLMSTGMAGDIREVKSTLVQHALAESNAEQRLNEYRMNQDAKLDILIRIAQTQCVNAATDVVQRRDCLAAGR